MRTFPIGTPKVPLTLISGLNAAANDRLAEQLLRPGTAVVHHDLRQITGGIVRRRLRLDGHDETVTLELAHGCVSCTLREDLLPLLRRLAGMAAVRHIVVRLDESMEPETVSWALSHVLVGDRTVSEDVEIETVVTTLDCDEWLGDAIGEDTLADRDRQASPEDERTVAQVAISQVEFADVLVLCGAAANAWHAAKTNAVLARVAPSAARVELAHATPAGIAAAVPARARRGEVTDMHGPLLTGEPPLHADCGVAVLLFTARRPFHPARLHDAIDVLLDGVVRTRGRAWVASQPDTALWIESAGGGLGVGDAGPWLDAAEGPAWEDVSAERRTLASLRWHPEFGDRAQELVVVTDLATPQEVESALRGALLTDEEFAAGRTAWLRYPDPFTSWAETPAG